MEAALGLRQCRVQTARQVRLQRGSRQRDAMVPGQGAYQPLLFSGCDRSLTGCGATGLLSQAAAKPGTLLGVDGVSGCALNGIGSKLRQTSKPLRWRPKPWRGVSGASILGNHVFQYFILLFLTFNQDAMNELEGRIGGAWSFGSGI